MALPPPPGDDGLPIIGESLSFLLEPANFALSRYRRFGPIFRSNILGRPTVFLAGPEAVQFVLQSGMEHFSWRDGWPDSFRTLLGESLFLQDGEEHRRNRRLLMPAFHGAALAGYFETMVATTNRYLERWEQMGEFAWFGELKQFTFEIAGELLLGTKGQEQISQLSRAFDELSTGLFAVLPFAIPFTPFARAVAARDQLRRHLRPVIAERRQHPGKDALSLLLLARDEEDQAMGDEEVIAQAMLLLFAGHETTTSMLTFLCLELARDAKVRQQAIDEQRSLGEGLHREQLEQMPYLDRILMEVERLHTPVPGGFRGVVKAFDIAGYHVPTGWLAVYSNLITHRMENLYPEPERFDPDRFVEGAPRPFSLLGFGGGPRVCIGLAFARMEMKIFASLLLRHYRWELLANQSTESVLIPTRRPKDGLRVKFGRSKPKAVLSRK
jgi:retinoid hydroxylase